MNKLITTLAILLSTTLYAQLDVTNDFNEWSFNSPQGVEPYGALTTNLEPIPYANDTTVFITSPMYYVNGSIQVDYLTKGRIQNNKDFVYFEYSMGGDWITLDIMTGNKNFVDYNHFLEGVQDSIQFRFKLVTSKYKNTYLDKWDNPRLFYYDFYDWSVYQETSLPVTFGGQESDCNTIEWWTQSENNSLVYVIEHSYDGLTWEQIGEEVWAVGFSAHTTRYEIENTKGGGFYRIFQLDFDGEHETFGPFEIDCNLSLDPLNNNKTVEGYYNTMGQEIPKETKGLKIVRYTDGTTKTIY